MLLNSSSLARLEHQRVCNTLYRKHSSTAHICRTSSATYLETSRHFTPSPYTKTVNKPWYTNIRSHAHPSDASSSSFDKVASWRRIQHNVLSDSIFVNSRKSPSSTPTPETGRLQYKTTTCHHKAEVCDFYAKHSSFRLQRRHNGPINIDFFTGLDHCWTTAGSLLDHCWTAAAQRTSALADAPSQGYVSGLHSTEEHRFILLEMRAREACCYYLNSTNY